MKVTPWLVLLLSLSLVACSGSKSAQTVNEETPQVELSDADEFIDSPGEATNEVGATEEAAPAEVAETTQEPPQEVAELAATEEVTPTEEPVAITSEPSIEPVAAVAATRHSGHEGELKHYTVQRNETLMLIAFKIYGDYDKWKHIASWNADTLNGSTAVRNGMTLKYKAPAEEFVWNPQGLPYLIRTGDTLGLISKSVYQTPKKWKSIWDNNRPLIKDPNRIFAGFTLYYLENGRDVAAEL